MPYPFTLNIHVANGDPDGLRIISRSNWNGTAVVFPRTLLPQVISRGEFKETGVYLLLGPADRQDREMLYIGEGDPILDRLKSHHANKDFWNRAVVFVAQKYLNKAHVQFLEAQLISQARAAKRVQLDNATQPTEPSLSEADRADLGVFLRHMLEMLPVLGVDAFEQAKNLEPFAATMLYCSGKGIKAQGMESTQGFVVKQGANAAIETVPSMPTSVCEFRQSLIENNLLALSGNHYVFTQDYTFSSPSMAATIVLGRSANGRTEWKSADGATLKALQAQQVNLT